MRPEALWKRLFEAEFLRLRSIGISEDSAIALAERYAEDRVDRYCDDKFHQRKEDGRDTTR